MTIYLIRHGETFGNQKKRYIGTTDEPLCHPGRCFLAQIREKHIYPIPDLLYCSPMLRCRETAEILFPGVEQQLIADLRECDFGEFENQNYQELAGNEAYQRWIDSNGRLPFPGGESREAFQERSLNAFYRLEKEWEQLDVEKTIAIVAHGGTLMSILEAVGIPTGSYYDFQVGNGEGYRLEGEKGQYHYQKLGE